MACSLSRPHRCVIGSALLSGTMALALAGCGGGSERTTASSSAHGKVTLDGVAVERGQLVFENTNPDAPKPNSLTVTFANGSYAVGGLYPGKYTVHCLPPAAGNGTAQPVASIPKSFRSATTSGLTVELVAGENVYDVSMK